MFDFLEKYKNDSGEISLSNLPNDITKQLIDIEEKKFIVKMKFTQNIYTDEDDEQDYDVYGGCVYGFPNPDEIDPDEDPDEWEDMCQDVINNATIPYSDMFNDVESTDDVEYNGSLYAYQFVLTVKSKPLTGKQVIKLMLDDNWYIGSRYIIEILE